MHHLSVGSTELAFASVFHIEEVASRNLGDRLFRRRVWVAHPRLGFEITQEGTQEGKVQ